MNKELFIKYGKKLVGPQPGTKGVLFIDNLNLPMKDRFGTVPVLELLRHIMDQQRYKSYSF